MKQQEYKYFAFISYNSLDYKWGKRIQKKLERYRMPATLCSKHGWKKNPMRPIFFAPTDIQPGGLSSELQERLKASRNLIVICSPNSARSEWVGKEIAFFHQLGRTEQIHFFIIDGIPHSGKEETECFNPIVNELSLPEILGANIHEKIYHWSWLNRERAYVQLITKLLGVEFDSIWQRHKRMLIEKVAAWIIGFFFVFVTMMGVWMYGQPVDVAISLQEATLYNKNLPPMKDAVVTLSLDSETKTDTIQTIKGLAHFQNIPHRYIDKEVRITFKCTDFSVVDTIVTLQRHTTINISRDASVYGNIHFRLWSESKGTFVGNTKIQIEDMLAISNAKGEVKLKVPLSRQRTEYKLHSSVHLKDSVLFMPYGKDCVIRTK